MVVLIGRFWSIGVFLPTKSPVLRCRLQTTPSLSDLSAVDWKELANPQVVSVFALALTELPLLQDAVLPDAYTQSKISGHRYSAPQSPMSRKMSAARLFFCTSSIAARSTASNVQP